MSAEVHPCCLTIAGSDSGGNALQNGKVSKEKRWLACVQRECAKLTFSRRQLENVCRLSWR